MRLSRDIGVVIPVYNRASMVTEAIQSVVAQPGFSWRIVVVDDASTDGSWEVVDDLRGHLPITAVRHERNRGVSAARNTALGLLSTSLVAFLDSDDLMLPGSYEALWSILNAQPEIDICHGLRKDVALPGGGEVLARAATSPQDTLCLSGTLIRARRVEATGLFDEELRTSEDLAWFARIPDLQSRVSVHQGVTMHRRLAGDNLIADPYAMRRARLAWVRKRLQPPDRP